MTEKRCTRCGEVKAVEEYGKDKRRGDGLQSRCKECMRAYDAKRYREHPEKVKASVAKWSRENPEKVRAKNVKWRRENPEKLRASQLKRRYGVSIPDYDAMLAAQGGGCAICHWPPGKRRLDIDHDHVTGAVRLILCSRCNNCVEKVEKDPTWHHRDPELDRAFHEYVEFFRLKRAL
jgi:hypothetical protein